MTTLRIVLALAALAIVPACSSTGSPVQSAEPVMHKSVTK